MYSTCIVEVQKFNFTKGSKHQNDVWTDDASSLVRSFARYPGSSFVRSFVHSFAPSFLPSLVRSFARSFALLVLLLLWREN